MGEELTTMIGRDGVAGGARHATQGRPRTLGAPVRMRFFTSAHAGSIGLKSCEYGRQVAHRGPALFDEEAHLRRFMRGEIVEQDHVTHAAGAARAGAGPIR